MKRLIDLLISLIMILLLSPLIFFVIILIKLLMGSPIFFIQNRIGINGVGFNIIKFRTMINNQHPKSFSNVTTSEDIRVTKLGKILRKTKIDEIPEFINVILGDMSIVGPRPEIPEYISKLNDKEKIILNVKPGITGPATLKYINEEEILSKQSNPEEYNEKNIYKDKISLNIDYVNKLSTIRDFKIMLLTFWSIITNAIKK
jgi:lipopolysaccharide/colanic/teichoic acid biosynthesis glycosyltransferase